MLKTPDFRNCKAADDIRQGMVCLPLIISLVVDGLITALMVLIGFYHRVETLLFFASSLDFLNLHGGPVFMRADILPT